jgi:hypothetical protein
VFKKAFEKCSKGIFENNSKNAFEKCRLKALQKARTSVSIKRVEKRSSQNVFLKARSTKRFAKQLKRHLKT